MELVNLDKESTILEEKVAFQNYVSLVNVGIF